MVSFGIAGEKSPPRKLQAATLSMPSRATRDRRIGPVSPAEPARAVRRVGDRLQPAVSPVVASTIGST